QRKKGLLEKELAANDRARQRILRQIKRDSITDAQADPQLTELRDRDLDIGADLARLDEDLAEGPASADLEVFVERVRGRGLSPLTGKPAVDILVHGDRVDPVVGDYLREKGYNDRDIMAVGVQQLGGNDLNTWLSMTEADKRNLVRSMLDGKVKGK